MDKEIKQTIPESFQYKDIRIRRKKRRIMLACCAIVLAAVVGLGCYATKELRQQLNLAGQMKADLKLLAARITEMDLDGSRQALDSADATAVQIRQSLTKPFWKFGAGLPMAKREMTAADQLLDIWDEASNSVIRPAIDFVMERPLSSLKQDKKINTELALEYLSFADEKLQITKQLLDTADEIELGLIDRNHSMKKMIGLASTGVNTLATRADVMIPLTVQQLQNYPLSNLRTEDGVNVTLACSYIDYAETVMPEVDGLLEDLNEGALGEYMRHEKIQKYVGKYEELKKIYEDNQDLIRLFRAFVGDGSDRHYLICAMNSAEIRAVGGYPGSIGTVSIENGCLSFGDFSSVYQVLSNYVSQGIRPDKTEMRLYSCPMTSMLYARDACLCPDFVRVGEIWARSYEDRNGRHVDGVVAMTPSVIQRLLVYTGDITLSDGTILTGKNATKVLQRDMYFRYFDGYMDDQAANIATDILFAETAKKTIRELFEYLTLDKILGYASAARKGIEDRTIMLWMKDPQAQTLVTDMGADGGLNRDSQKPATGVYINYTAACKMGWFLDADIQVGAPVKNADNSRTYPVHVLLRNSITNDEIRSASRVYVLGGLWGGIQTSIYVFGPAEGTISDIKINRNISPISEEYHGLEVRYIPYARIDPSAPLEISYNVTTAPGVETPLTVQKTPTLEMYY